MLADASAPTSGRIQLTPRVSARVASSPTKTAPQKLKLLIFFTRSYSRAPREREIKAQPPMPNRLPNAMRIINTGAAMETAFI